MSRYTRTTTGSSIGLKPASTEKTHTCRHIQDEHTGKTGSSSLSCKDTDEPLANKLVTLRVMNDEEAKDAKKIGVLEEYVRSDLTGQSWKAVS